MVRRRLLPVLAVALVLAAGCGDDGDSNEVFDREEFPFTFEYPGDLEESGDVTIAQALGAQADETAAVGLDDDNAIVVQTFTLNIEIDESNLDLARREIDSLAQQADPNASSEKTEVAGLPALTVDDLEVPTIENGTSRLIIVFDGDQEYYLNCQSTPDEAAEIDAACDLAVETFAVK